MVVSASSSASSHVHLCFVWTLVAAAVTVNVAAALAVTSFERPASRWDALYILAVEGACVLFVGGLAARQWDRPDVVIATTTSP